MKEWSDESWDWYESICREVDQAGGVGDDENATGARSTARPVPYLNKKRQSFLKMSFFKIVSQQCNRPHKEAKDGYTIDLPYSIPECSHLQRDLVEKCLLNQVHKPVNPHSQRLIVASKKATEPLPKAEPKPKANAKAKAKGKSKAKAKAESKTATKKDEKTEYSKAKQEFLERDEKLAKT